MHAQLFSVPEQSLKKQMCMKKKALKITPPVIMLLCIFIAGLISIPKEYAEIHEDYLVEEEILYTVVPETEAVSPETARPPFIGRALHGFKEAMGFKESRGNYFAVNSFGYLGKYQFGASALRAVGVYNTRSFLRKPEIQEKAFIAYLERNKWVLREEIEAFSGKTLRGIQITESGILAAAHLAGPQNVKRYLRSLGNHNASDANGASIRYYMKKFSGYDLSRIAPDKEAKI